MRMTSCRPPESEISNRKSNESQMDLINRRDAINAFWELNISLRPSAIDAIINMLRTVPSANLQPNLQPTCNQLATDCISRRAAIDALKKAYWDKDIQSAKDDPCIVDAMTDWAIRQVKALPPAQPDIDEWCHDCKEYDKERHCCPRWNRVIRQTLKDAQPDLPEWARKVEEYRESAPDTIYNPLAWALYQVWKEYDR